MPYFHTMKVNEIVQDVERESHLQCANERHLRYAYTSFNGFAGYDSFISSRTKKSVKECDNPRPDFQNSAFISSIPCEWPSLSPQSQARLMPLLIWLMSLFDDNDHKGYSKVERHGTGIEVFCRILRQSVKALQNKKIITSEVIFGKNRVGNKSIELKWASLVEFDLSEDIQTCYKAKVGDKRKLQFSCSYQETNEVVRRGRKNFRIKDALVAHAIQICESVVSMLEHLDGVCVGLQEFIQSQVLEIVKAQQPIVMKTIIDSEYFSKNRQDMSFGTALAQTCDKISELFFNTISCINEGSYFDRT